MNKYGMIMKVVMIVMHLHYQQYLRLNSKMILRQKQL